MCDGEVKAKKKFLQLSLIHFKRRKDKECQKKNVVFVFNRETWITLAVGDDLKFLLTEQHLTEKSVAFLLQFLFFRKKVGKQDFSETYEPIRFKFSLMKYV